MDLNSEHKVTAETKFFGITLKKTTEGPQTAQEIMEVKYGRPDFSSGSELVGPGSGLLKGAARLIGLRIP